MQMGSNMKRSIFDEQTAKGLENWRHTARERKKTRDTDMMMAQMIGNATPSRGTSPMLSRGTSPVHLLRKSNKRSDDLESVPTSPRNEMEASDMYPVVLHPVHRLDQSDRRRSVSSSALDVDNTSAEFSFAMQR